MINPELSGSIGYWYALINCCYFYGYFRDPFYISFHIAKHSEHNPNFIETELEHTSMTKEIVVDIILTINILISALTTFRR